MIKKVKMITENNYNVDIVESEKKHLFIEGVFASSETKNENGRIYPKNLLENRVEKIQDDVKNRICYGELNHPTDRCEVDLSQVSHLIENLEWNGNDVYGRARVLEETPKGMTLKGILKHGKVGVSSRGTGTTRFDESRSAEIVEDNFSLITWDVIHKASNPSSRFVNGILEGREFTIPDSHIIEPDERQVQEALKSHEKKIWQVIENIQKNL